MATRNFDDSMEQHYSSTLGSHYDSIHAMMHLAMNVSDYAIYLIDTEGSIATWNAGAKRLKGYEYDDVFGKHYSMFFTQIGRAHV